jgi:hypothetical protein
MFHLVYLSSATSLLSKPQLLELLAKSRDNNVRAGITGLLLYKEGNFMQVLEGEEREVLATHSRIECDSRHKGLITLLSESIPERRFPGWSMSLRDLASPEVRSTPGFSEFLNTPLTGQEFSSQPRACERLLLSFKKAM